MQINDLFGRAAAFETARLPDGTAAVLPAEHAAALYVNERTKKHPPPGIFRPGSGCLPLYNGERCR